MLKFIRKHIIHILAILLFINIILNFMSIFSTNVNDGSLIEELSKSYEKQSKTFKRDTDKFIKDYKSIKETDDLFKHRIDTTKKADAKETLLIDYSFFLNDWSLSNDEWSITNEHWSLCLTNWHTVLIEKDKLIERKIMRWRLEPYLMLYKADAWRIGGGIDLRIPLTHDFALLTGVSYMNRFTFRLGFSLSF